MSEEQARQVIWDLLEAFDAVQECDCGGSSLCPLCNAHRYLQTAYGKEIS